MCWFLPDEGEEGEETLVAAGDGRAVATKKAREDSSDGEDQVEETVAERTTAKAEEDEDEMPYVEQQTKPITENQAKTMLGFDSVFLWKNEEKPNTTFVEDQLQERYHHLGLPRRLHRRIGMGDNGYDDDDEDELHKVFLAYSFDVQDAIDAGEVVVVV